MSKFKVKSSKNNWPDTEINYTRPVSVTDEAWLELVGNVSAINDLALKAWVIEAQRVARDGKTPAEAQLKVDGWQYKGDSAPTVMNLGGMEFEQFKIDALLAENPGISLTNYSIIEED